MSADIRAAVSATPTAATPTHAGRYAQDFGKLRLGPLPDEFLGLASPFLGTPIRFDDRVVTKSAR